MNLILRLSLACICLPVLAGCQTLRRPISVQTVCHSEEAVSTTIRVRTGGLLNTNTETHRSIEDNLTLRQLLLESGGFRKPEQTLVRREIVLPPAIPRIDSNPVTNTSVATVRQQLETVESIFGEAEQDRLEALFVDPINAAYWEPLKADRILDPAEYLRLILEQIKLRASFQPAGEWFNRDNRNLNELATTAIALFNFNRDRNPDYVDDVVGKLRTLTSDSQVASVVQSTVTRTPSVQFQTQSLPSNTVFIDETKSDEMVLVGILRDGKTIYFHPFLIDHTALGEILIKDKDFVFAIEANRTSLRSHPMESPDFYVPVAGVNSKFNSVLASKHPTFRDILGLVEVDQFTDDSVLIVDRASLQKNTFDSFHLPLAYLGENIDSAKQILSECKVQPGDSVAFTKALYTPIVQSEFLAQVERISNNIKESNGRMKTVQNAANQSRIVRTASSLSESARYMARRLTSPIAK